MDMAVELSERALEVVRLQIEAAAAAAKEAASHSLLRELEEEAAQQAFTKKVWTLQTSLDFTVDVRAACISALLSHMVSRLAAAGLPASDIPCKGMACLVPMQAGCGSKCIQLQDLQ